MFSASVDTVIGQINHTLIENSPVTEMILESILKELMNTRVVKKAYKHKYQQAKAIVATTLTPVPTVETATATLITPVTTTRDFIHKRT